MELSLIVQGIIIGLTLAVPVGPISLLCIHRTVADGVPFYLEDGTGKVLVDAHGAECDLIRTAWRETGGISLQGIFEAFRDIHSPPRFLVDDNELINYAASLS